MKSSYVLVAKGKSMSKEVSMEKDKTLPIHLTDTDLVKVEDVSKVVLVKVKNIDTIKMKVLMTLRYTMWVVFGCGSNLTQRVCIAMKRQSFIFKVANVVINKASYPFQVQEVGSWNILISDDIESTDSEDGHFDEECKSVNVVEKPLKDLDDILE
nr:RNA-directed DNA polymerase, eukaryota, reverse transcriptase zinc-binding domain protein [Tanacetum cinerariifolium]